MESETKPTRTSVTSNSISFDFQTEVPILTGTEEYYKYYVQYRVAGGTDWLNRPPIDHPVGVTATRTAISHTINNLAADTEYQIQIAVCRVWYGVNYDCRFAPNPVVTIRTGEKPKF